MRPEWDLHHLGCPLHRRCPLTRSSSSRLRHLRHRCHQPRLRRLRRFRRHPFLPTSWSLSRHHRHLLHPHLRLRHPHLRLRLHHHRHHGSSSSAEVARSPPVLTNTSSGTSACMLLRARPACTARARRKQVLRLLPAVTSCLYVSQECCGSPLRLHTYRRTSRGFTLPPAPLAHACPFACTHPKAQSTRVHTSVPQAAPRPSSRACGPACPPLENERKRQPWMHVCERFVWGERLRGQTRSSRAAPPPC